MYTPHLHLAMSERPPVLYLQRQYGLCAPANAGKFVRTQIMSQSSKGRELMFHRSQCERFLLHPPPEMCSHRTALLQQPDLRGNHLSCPRHQHILS